MSLLSSWATCSLSTRDLPSAGSRGDERADAAACAGDVADVVVGATAALPAIVPPVPRTTTVARRRFAFSSNWMKIQDWMYIQRSPETRSEPQPEARMNETPKLTDRQQQILDLVQSAIERTGAPPTRAEIANELGFQSANAAEEHLQALARKGVIELVGGTSRGIRLQSDTLRALNQARGKQFSLPLPSLAQLSLPLVGRVAAGSPILAQEHIDRPTSWRRACSRAAPTTCSRCAA